MYEVKLTLTGQTYILEDLEGINDILESYEYTTLKDIKLHTLYDSEVESLDDFIKNSSMMFELVYDTKTLSMLYKINDLQQAIALLNSEYWDKSYHHFSHKIMSNPLFLKERNHHSS